MQGWAAEGGVDDGSCRGGEGRRGGLWLPSSLRWMPFVWQGAEQESIGARCVLVESRAGEILLLAGLVCVLFWRKGRGGTCIWCRRLYGI